MDTSPTISSFEKFLYPFTNMTAGRDEVTGVIPRDRICIPSGEGDMSLSTNTDVKLKGNMNANGNLTSAVVALIRAKSILPCCSFLFLSQHKFDLQFACCVLWANELIFSPVRGSLFLNGVRVSSYRLPGRLK